MRQEKEPTSRLSTEELLVVASKINKLYEATPDSFDPAAQVADAQDIINTLHPRIEKLSRHISLTFGSPRSPSALVEGTTSAGNLSVNVNDKKRKRIKIGIKEYRIGNYVVTKLRRIKTMELSFEPFWDRGRNNVSGNPPDRKIIVYNPTSLELLRINIETSTVKRLGRTNMTVTQKIPVWEKD